MSGADKEIKVGRLDELDDPGSRAFEIGEGDWPFRGFVVRQGDECFISIEREGRSNLAERKLCRI